MKKVLGVITAVAMLGTAAYTGAISSSAFTGGEIYFEVPEYWQENNKYLYVHCWDDLKGESPYEWHSKNQKMTWTTGEETAAYPIPDGDWNVLIVSGDSGMETANLVFNADCIGDTCYIPDDAELLTAPSDSAKTVYPIAWRNHSKCGMQKWITPLGNIVGTTLLTGQTNQDLYERFVVLYEGEEKTEDWNTTKAEIVGKDWETIKKELIEKLGLTIPTEIPTEITTENPTDVPTEIITEISTESSTETSTETESTTGTYSGNPETASSDSQSTAKSLTENNNTANTTSGKVVNTADTNSVYGVLAGVFLLALGLTFISRKKSEN